MDITEVYDSHYQDIPGFFVDKFGRVIEISDQDSHAEKVFREPELFGIEKEELDHRISDDTDVYRVLTKSGWCLIRKWKKGSSSHWTVVCRKINSSKRAIEKWADYVVDKYPDCSSDKVIIEEMNNTEMEFSRSTTIEKICAGYLDTDEYGESLAKTILKICEELSSEKEACKEDALEVIGTLQKAGYKAVFAGGCVRDAAMGLTPHDYDVATSATVEEVQKLFPKIIHVGEVFGVTRVVMPSGVIEVATFRKDIGSEKGRRPQSVEYADMEGDASRRDFTINAMFHDPIADQIHDYVGGMIDLKKKVLKFVGNPDERIQEDHLRMLRLVRFAAKLGFTPDESSLRAVKKNAELAKKISAERIREEMTKMLTGTNPDKAIRLMQETGLLEQVLPEVSALDGLEQPAKYHPEGDVFQHTVIVLSKLNHPSEDLSWAALLHDIGKKSTYEFDKKKDRVTFNGHDKTGAELAESVLRRLKFPGKATNNIVWLIENHMKIHKFFDLGDSKKALLMRSPLFDTLLQLSTADGEASAHEDESPKIRDFVQNAPDRLHRTDPLINGEDLKKMGLKPGPNFKLILDKVATKQIEGTINSREDALKFATHMARSLGAKTEGLARDVIQEVKEISNTE